MYSFVCLCVKKGRRDIITFLVRPTKRNKAKATTTERWYFLQPLRNKNKEREKRKERNKKKNKSKPSGAKKEKKRGYGSSSDFLIRGKRIASKAKKNPKHFDSSYKFRHSHTHSYTNIHVRAYSTVVASVENYNWSSAFAAPVRNHFLLYAAMQ